MPNCYHTGTIVQRPDGVYVVTRFDGGHMVDGPAQPGDYVKNEDGQFYQIAQIITVVYPVDDDV